MPPLTPLNAPPSPPPRPARAGRSRRGPVPLLAGLVVALLALVALAPATGAAPAPAPTGRDGGRAAPPTADPQLRPIDDDPPDLPEPPEDPEPPEPPDDPEPPVDEEPTPPPPAPECDAAGGFTRPAGAIPPGYVYSPTTFDGTIVDPQPDDTWAVDGDGHATHIGSLRTRFANGREELLVCAHLGTTTPTDALTPFATTGAGAHPATITARVVLIDAAGASTSYDLGSDGIEGSITHYAGSTDAHEGIAQLWVPFTANLHEPGFITRVEVRGTAALAGGATKVMGADEVFVHLGPAPLHETTRVPQALGVALDDSIIAERPTDPGTDDLTTLLAPVVEPMLAEAIEDQAPISIDDDWGWESGVVGGLSAGGSVNSLDAFVHSFAVEPENVTADEGRIRVSFAGTIRPKMTLEPRSIGLVSFISGTCSVESFMTFRATATFTIDLTPDGARPLIDIGGIDVAVDPPAFVTSNGNIWALGLVFPFSYSCRNFEDRIEDGIVEKTDELATSVDDQALQLELEGVIDDALDVADLATGPLSTASISLPNGVGFGLSSARYVPTAPPWHSLGDVSTTAQGIDLAAGVLVSDQGAVRFPYSYAPSSTISVADATHNRSRRSGGEFDVGLIVNGASVNQLARALTAGRPDIPVLQPAALNGPFQLPSYPDIGLLDSRTSVPVGSIVVDVTVRPSMPPMYLPTAPTGWPTPGAANLYLPSLRTSLTEVAGVATVATDVRVGVEATVDGSGHLVPLVAEHQVTTRFLRLGNGANVITDPALAPLEPVSLVAAEIAATVPTKLAQVLRPITVPDIDNGVGDKAHLQNLTIGSTGGGHLAAYADLVPGAAPTTAPTTISTTWATDQDDPELPPGAPTSFTTSVTPVGLPGSAPVTADWTITGQDGAVVYRSPAGGEPLGPKTLPATELARSADPCTGDLVVSVSISVTLTRGLNQSTQSTGSGYIYAGTPPTNPPAGCNEPPEPPVEDPEDPPIPPICLRQPWKCPDL